MSRKDIPTPVSHVVCDLCDKPMGTADERFGERVNLIYGQVPQPQERVRPKRFTFRGERQGYQKVGLDKYRTREFINWDFHPECLIDALYPLINKDETDATPD